MTDDPLDLYIWTEYNSAWIQMEAYQYWSLYGR